MPIDLEAIRASNAKRKSEHDSNAADPCYEGHHEHCVGAEDIDILLAEVERLTTCSPTNHMGCELKDGGLLTCFCDAVRFRVVSAQLPGTGARFMRYLGAPVNPFGVWIPVTERLPEFRTTCLIVVDDGDEPEVLHGVLVEGGWLIAFRGPVESPDVVTYWQPMPESPR